MEKPGERPAALTPDQWERAATQRKQDADLRDRLADERDAEAELRDRLADERDARADERDAEADLRDRLADERDARADERDAEAELRDRLADERDARADERDADAELRDRLADERDARADERDRELLSESATARLQARLETMPVIEQAKGVIMRQNRCTEEQAFDLLRKASQRSNVPVRELAARIMASYQPEAPKPRSPGLTTPLTTPSAIRSPSQ